MRAKDAVGLFGERVAVRHLEDAGYAVLSRNWRCPAGEIDVVAIRGGVVVFAEVKTRRSEAYGPPALAVTRKKAARVRAAAVDWLSQHLLHDTPVRFDVVAVRIPRTGAAEVEHIEGAF
ncbi:MAG TPA: YraN family protein [Mycobacteriales bacterium]|nr:YraN family protein [Mycobacteriales bacterium]